MTITKLISHVILFVVGALTTMYMELPFDMIEIKESIKYQNRILQRMEKRLDNLEKIVNTKK